MIELCCDLAQMPPHGDYHPRNWPSGASMAKTINQWGGAPTPRFLLTGFPIVPPDQGRPAWAMAPARTAAARA